MIKINLDDKQNLSAQLLKLNAGDRVLLSGTIFTARDAVHKIISENLKNGEKPTYLPTNSIIYYAGPTDTPPGKAIGSIGPTTSVRMDAYAPMMKELQVVATIGKGERSEFAKKVFSQDKILYFITTGGCGALLSSSVKNAQVVGLDHLGCESVKKLTVENFPVTVAYDLHEGDIFND